MKAVFEATEIINPISITDFPVHAANVGKKFSLQLQNSLWKS